MNFGYYQMSPWASEDGKGFLTLLALLTPTRRTPETPKEFDHHRIQYQKRFREIIFDIKRSLYVHHVYSW
jgi:hypothetical protein